MSMKVAVVGAGICGLSAARALAARGHQVTLFEQFGLFHSRGSSHGESRIVRRAYPDHFYTQLMGEAYPLWRELEQETGRTLFHEVGLLYIGREESPTVRSTLAGLESNRVEHQVLRSHPSFLLEPDELAILTPEAGWVEAQAALEATWRLAEATGRVQLVQSNVDPLEASRSHDAVVLCAGPWIRRHVPLPVNITKVTFGYLQTRLDGPVWIEDSDALLYGFPSTDLGAKVGVHSVGEEIDPDKPDRQPDRRCLDLIRDFGRRRLGTDAQIQHAGGCLYTNAPNEDFILGRMEPNILYASACSGHGFKFGPWIGRLLTDFVEGRSNPERYPRFSATAS